MYYKFNSEFIIRLLTGIIYILLIFFAIEQGDKLFRILMMIFSYICFFELLIIFKIYIKLIQSSLYILICPILIDLIISKKLYIIFFIIYYIYIMFQLFCLKCSYKEKINQIIHVLFGLFYIIIPFYLSTIIYSNFDHGKDIILNTFLMIWTNDTCSFIIGKQLGKNIISISISPKKTVEGVFGGMLFCFILSLYIQIWWLDIEWIFLSIVISIFATIGDFIESIIKRSYNVKHSGILFPGHGGFLDRFDSYIIVIPIITIIFFIKHLII
ncbi:phosphatidate cytidylyltransferase [Blattabacterium cuenoti]|uniref:phosphatidate cytidylyltransferase n=1 Tax=Blattabacterium cuenoti TaxID=1653831 RepID=UPI00163C2BF8|nr:phosphatidate cytidylyltransferase [Blattabacterium cuenoti]